jgi:hypothetical protein
VGGGGRDGAGDSRGMGVAEIDAAAEHDGGEEQAEVRDDGLGDGWLVGVDGEREHDDDAAGAGGDGKGERVEGFLLEGVNLSLGDGGDGSVGGVGFLMAECGVLLVQERPADHGDDDPSGELHDGEGDAEETEDRGADEFDDGEEDDGVDGDFAGQGTVGLGGSIADEAEKDERGAEGVDEWKKRAKAQSEVLPEKVHRSTSMAFEIVAMPEAIVRWERRCWRGISF